MLQCVKNALGFHVLPNMTVPSMCLHIGRLKRIDLFTHDMLNNSHCPQVPRAIARLCLGCLSPICLSPTYLSLTYRISRRRRQGAYA